MTDPIKLVTARDEAASEIDRKLAEVIECLRADGDKARAFAMIVLDDGGGVRTTFEPGTNAFALLGGVDHLKSRINQFLHQEG